MNYVTDTHSLVWYFTADSRLSKKALDAFESTIAEGMIIVPAVVLAEIMYLAKKGRIHIAFEDVLVQIEEYENITVAALDVDILRAADKLEYAFEMHDRLIVATAVYLEADGLITKDGTIISSGIVPVVW